MSASAPAHRKCACPSQQAERQGDLRACRPAAGPPPLRAWVGLVEAATRVAKPRLGGLVPPLPVAVPAAPAWPSLCISGPKPASVPDRFSFPYAGPRPVLLAYEHEEGPMTDEIWACPPRGQPRVPSPSRPEFTEQTSELRTFEPLCAQATRLRTCGGALSAQTSGRCRSHGCPGHVCEEVRTRYPEHRPRNNCTPT